MELHLYSLTCCNEPTGPSANGEYSKAGRQMTDTDVQRGKEAPNKPTTLKVHEAQVIHRYRCMRCHAAHQMWVNPEWVQKSIPCRYCGTGRMRADGLPPATGFKTKSQRWK